MDQLEMGGQATLNKINPIRRLAFYSTYMWRFVILRRVDPLIYGLALTDRCNLSCRGCRVSNTGRRDMTWNEVLAALRKAWGRGFRELYLSGGEPTLWRDGERTLSDIIVAARRIGYYHIHVYTNGLCGLEPAADLVWVSMDGLPGTFEKRRGDHFHQVESSVRGAAHPHVAIIYVIDRYTVDGIEPFLRWVVDSRFPVIGVMFYFHTPYYGHDDLFLSALERAPIIDRLLLYIRGGLPILNSRAGLQALKSGDWPRRLPISAILDVDGESICCRAADHVCAECGYAACTELTECQRLRPSALRAALRYW